MDSVNLAENIFNKHAQQYLDKFRDVSRYHDSLDIFCKLLPRYATLLEVGTGPGNVSKYVLDNRADIQLTGIDVAENMLELARLQNPNAIFLKMDCRNIASLKDEYDGIISSFCFPYLSQEEVSKFIQDARKKLVQRGVIYVSTMEGDYSSSGLETAPGGESLYIHYHEHRFLADVLTENNFDIIDSRREQYNDDRGKAVIDLLMVARSK